MDLRLTVENVTKVTTGVVEDKENVKEGWLQERVSRCRQKDAALGRNFGRFSRSVAAVLVDIGGAGVPLPCASARRLLPEVFDDVSCDGRKLCQGNIPELSDTAFAFYCLETGVVARAGLCITPSCARILDQRQFIASSNYQVEVTATLQMIRLQDRSSNVRELLDHRMHRQLWTTCNC